MFGVIAYAGHSMNVTLYEQGSTYVGLTRVDLIRKAKNLRIVIEHVEVSIAETMRQRIQIIRAMRTHLRTKNWK